MRRIAAISLILGNFFERAISRGGMRLAKYKRFFLAATASNASFGYLCLLASGEPEDTLETEGLPSGRSSSSDSSCCERVSKFRGTKRA